MYGDTAPVSSLIRRFASRLPHRTGSSRFDIDNDDLLVLTRRTLRQISRVDISTTAGGLVQLLEELARPYKGLELHPSHVLLSEVYVLNLLADCCIAHQDACCGRDLGEEGAGFAVDTQDPVLEAFDDRLASRIIDVTRKLLLPFDDDVAIHPKALLDESQSRPRQDWLSSATTRSTYHGSSKEDYQSSDLLPKLSEEIEWSVRRIISFVTASNWTSSFVSLRTQLRSLQHSQPSHPSTTQLSPLSAEERNVLLFLRIVAFYWVDATKLGVILQDFCGSFLHLKRPLQYTLTSVLHLLVIKWIERRPVEFNDLHTSRRRLDGGADTLFDMISATAEGGRTRTSFYSCQIALLFLLPDVWDVATGMREVKGNPMTKKIAFLDGLRKGIRNHNPMAAYCLVSLLYAARHFAPESDASFPSFALDVQDEVREALFQRQLNGVGTASFEYGLMIASLVSIAYLDYKTYVGSVLPLCLATTASFEVKAACISACCHLAKDLHAEDYEIVFVLASDFARAHLESVMACEQPSNASHNFDTIKSSTSGKEATCQILKFIDYRPLALFDGAPGELEPRIAFFNQSFSSFVACLAEQDSAIRDLARAASKKVLVALALLLRRDVLTSGSEAFAVQFWRAASFALLDAYAKVIGLPGPDSSLLSFIVDFIEARLQAIKARKGVVNVDQHVADALLISTKLEMNLLVSLCSPDIEICRLVIRCIASLCEEAQLTYTPLENTKQFIKINLDAYTALSSRQIQVISLVAVQKWVRNCFLQMKHPTAGILQSWELAFDRWVHFSQQVTSGDSGNNLNERSLVEWRNYSGFLASLGGLCVSEQASASDESSMSGLRWIDRQDEGENDDTLLEQYLQQSIRLLGCLNLRVREATREVLSSELTPLLYPYLFRAMEAELGRLVDIARKQSPLESNISHIYLEQAASLFKALVERSSTSELGIGLFVDIGVFTLKFVRHVDQAFESESILRTKVKLCHLCEIVSQKKELLNLRHDVRIRNQLLDILFRWISRPKSPDDNASTGRSDTMSRLQRDVDRACLKVFAVITYMLPLQVNETQIDTEDSDVKLQLFRTYFNRFLSLLRIDSSDSVESAVAVREDYQVSSASELSITALSNLLSANIDIGLKHCLSIGYHEDITVRIAFTRVLCSVLDQGMTDLHTLSDSLMVVKYDDLLKLLTENLDVTIALCDACPSTEVDELTVSLLNVFESRGLGFVLLEALITHEVNQTDNEAELLRRNCITTRMLSIYAKWKGSAYLKSTLSKVLERLVATENDLDLELDPVKTTSSEELEKNALQLRLVTTVFIDDICRSSNNIPPPLQKICNTILSVVMARFPDAKFTAVGAFIFLRFFCPAIVAPEVEGLISKSPSREMRRGLLLIAKIVQNLANNILFGAKETYMVPLNDFLTQNIYRVTAFLREISAPLAQVVTSEIAEAFDFGSCVAIHRYLYDHWDHVRQRILVERRKHPQLHLPTDGSVRAPSVIDLLRDFITNLGPPPMDVSWNRPSLAYNDPPSYSRFQDFMLRNSGRSDEGLVATRAIYDGGESKDGLSIICIILRSLDENDVDDDLLVHSYLKIASRMWHKPFGILVDATCYNGQNEPQDTLFRKLELLTPAELTKSLSRVYIYNMNSAFRKCFRRIIRISARSGNSPFHPTDVDYHLIGNIQELQAHFNSGQLSLPQETMSMATDARFVFQPITRLSKTKGRIDVLMKIGSQFVQITTSKKQEIVPGLRLHATINDIFRLGELEEAPTSIQTEDDSAFGLRTDNGRIVMYFTSSKRAEIINNIRSAKMKNSKDEKTSTALERLVRPQDVPGTLLNIALSNMIDSESMLRIAAYKLLCALCKAFNFSAKSSFLSAPDLFVPRVPLHLIVDISTRLAESEPQLTSDFLNEFFVSWEHLLPSQRSLSLAYMVPWLPSLRSQMLVIEADGEKARDKIATIFRKLLEISISDSPPPIIFEQNVWPCIGRDETQLDIFLEELLKLATTSDIDSRRLDILGSIIASIDVLSIQGKLVSRLRKALNRSSLRPTRYLTDNVVWAEIAVLIHLCVATSFKSGAQARLLLPELFHVVTMLSNTGAPRTRSLIQHLLTNTIHALCTTLTLDDNKLGRLNVILTAVSGSKSDAFMSIPFAGKDVQFLTQGRETGHPSLSSIERLASMLSDITLIAAPTTDLSNAWRSRWMSLVASTAFQSNPAIQPRAFAVMGCLAREDVDDDLIYQVLVALRYSLNRLLDDHDEELFVSITTSLTKMMEKLSSASRYGLHLFWLAISLVRFVPATLFNCSALLLEAALQNISTSGDFANGCMVATLVRGRLLLEEVASQLDELYGIHFDLENFHFAISVTLAKGLANPITKSTTLKVVSRFLEVTANNSQPDRRYPNDLSCLPYIAIAMARAESYDEAKDILWLAGIHSESAVSPDSVLEKLNFSGLQENELVLAVAFSILDFGSFEDRIQERTLDWLQRVSLRKPEVLQHLQGPLFNLLQGVLVSCESIKTLESAHNLLKILTSRNIPSEPADSEQALAEILDNIGFGGIWRAATFPGTKEPHVETARLNDKLIELIIA